MTFPRLEKGLNCYLTTLKREIFGTHDVICTNLFKNGDVELWRINSWTTVETPWPRLISARECVLTLRLEKGCVHSSHSLGILYTQSRQHSGVIKPSNCRLIIEIKGEQRKEDGKREIMKKRKKRRREKMKEGEIKKETHEKEKRRKE